MSELGCSNGYWMMNHGPAVADVTAWCVHEHRRSGYLCTDCVDAFGAGRMACEECLTAGYPGVALNIESSKELVTS